MLLKNLSHKLKRKEQLKVCTCQQRRWQLVYMCPIIKNRCEYFNESLPPHNRSKRDSKNTNCVVMEKQTVECAGETKQLKNKYALWLKYNWRMLSGYSIHFSKIKHPVSLNKIKYQKFTYRGQGIFKHNRNNGYVSKFGFCMKIIIVLNTKLSIWFCLMKELELTAKDFSDFYNWVTNK